MVSALLNAEKVRYKFDGDFIPEQKLFWKGNKQPIRS